jgi:hypothetical protein
VDLAGLADVARGRTARVWLTRNRRIDACTVILSLCSRRQELSWLTLVIASDRTGLLGQHAKSNGVGQSARLPTSHFFEEQSGGRAVGESRGPCLVCTFGKGA